MQVRVGWVWQVRGWVGVAGEGFGGCGRCILLTCWILTGE